jgi:hypothetical protein
MYHNRLVRFTASLVLLLVLIGSTGSRPFARTEANQVISSEEISQKMIAKQQFAESAYEFEKISYNDISTISKTYEVIKAVIPCYDWYKTYNVVKGTPSDSYLQGSNWADQVHYLYTLPVPEMQRVLGETLTALRESDPRLALNFSAAVVHYSNINASINTLTSVALLFAWAIFLIRSSVIRKLQLLFTGSVDKLSSFQQVLHSFSLFDRKNLRVLAFSIGVMFLAWIFAYETNPNGYTHRNRYTGAVCSFDKNCW